jgi:hypothetical protein
MTKKYRVTLMPAEREELERLLARGKADVRKIKHAQILLKADETDDGPAWTDVRIAEAVEAGTATVERRAPALCRGGARLSAEPLPRRHAGLREKA